MKAELSLSPCSQLEFQHLLSTVAAAGRHDGQHARLRSLPPPAGGSLFGTLFGSVFSLFDPQYAKAQAEALPETLHLHRPTLQRGRPLLFSVLRLGRDRSQAVASVSRAQLQALSGLPAAALRRVDPTLCLSVSEPLLRVCEATGCLLVNVGAVRLLVLPDHALLLEPETEGGRRFTAALGVRMVDGSTAFSLDCLEAALQDATGELELALQSVWRRTTALLRGCQTEDAMKEFYINKQGLEDLQKSSSALRAALTAALDAPAQLAALGGEEAETVLLFFLQRCEAVVAAARRLKDVVDDLDDTMTVSLGRHNFEVNKVSAIIGVAAFAAGTGSLFSGIMGMNLHNGSESSVAAFAIATTFILVSCASLACGLLFHMRQRRVL